MPDESRILTVNGLNEYVKMLIDGNPVLSNIYVRGEISNLNYHSSGHYYFSLKDENARVSAVMFKSAVIKLKFRPENGMKVVLHGRVSVYPRDGAYQLYATSLEPDGVGALTLAYEQLKRKLEAEGLFRADLKKPLPKIPSAVGIITSPTGAAVRDIINVCGRRFPFAKLVLFPSLVQGEGAEADLIRGIKYFNESGSVDVIIIGRGGGSIEDLWAFNSESLAREIFKCDIPVISAVGHETDFTICDFVSDKRAPTPSAAAELAVPESEELKRKFGNVVSRMQTLTEAKLKTHRQMLKMLSERRALTQPSAYIDDKRMMLISLTKELESSVNYKLTTEKQKFARLSSVLEAVSPLKVISKGYSAVFKEGGKLVKSVDDLNEGDDVSFKLTDGSINAKVVSKQKA
ncbi:MAG: exodeoxyribonuclease VII large subunit [Ruminococcaceae bacterium]|nr:exodeoxyribonuclease VII large subunit [Oscillospiraceae bacterium]